MEYEKFRKFIGQESGPPELIEEEVNTAEQEKLKRPFVVDEDGNASNKPDWKRLLEKEKGSPLTREDRKK